MVVETFSAEETFQFGKKIGLEAEPGTVYTLIGDLGVGKTVFTQGLAEGLGIDEPINSLYKSFGCASGSKGIAVYLGDMPNYPGTRENTGMTFWGSWRCVRDG